MPVSDRRLAEILALLADEWEASDERSRVQLETRFHAYFPELSGGAAVGRVIAWLGWRVIGGKRKPGPDISKGRVEKPC